MAEDAELGPLSLSVSLRLRRSADTAGPRPSCRPSSISWPQSAMTTGSSGSPSRCVTGSACSARIASYPSILNLNLNNQLV